MGDRKDMPDGWEVERLGDFVIYQKGKKPKRIEKKQTQESPFPYVNIKAFEKNIIDDFTDGEGCVLCEDGDFLMVWDGARSGYIGKAIKGALGSTLVKINFPGIFLNYAYYFLQSKYLLINTKAKGTGIPHVDPDLLWNYYFPIPSLPEQNQIVSKIEELFSELDNGIESLKKAWEQLKTYRQAVLKYAFEGKLTKESRTLQRRAGNLPEPAEKLLEHIKEEREKHYLKQCQIAQNNGERRPIKLDTSFIEKNKPSFGLPSNWVWCRITDLFIELTDYHANGSYKKLKEKVKLFNEPNYALMVRATNFEKKDFKNSCKYISKEAYRFLSKSKLYGGELLIGKIGNAGKVYYMPLLNRPASLAMNLFALRFDSESVSKYVYYHLISPFSEKDISSYVKGVGNITIDKKSVRSLLIALPPFKEQHAIVQEIESRLSVCDKIEQTIEDSLKKAEALRQSILKKAFEGELTKDWRLPAGRQGKNGNVYIVENRSGKLMPKRKEVYFVYVLECEDGSIYKGVTSNLNKRINDHLAGIGAEWTKTHRPIALIHYEEFKSEKEAAEREKYFKSGVGREWLKELQKEKAEQYLSAERLLEKIKAEKKFIAEAQRAQRKTKD